VVFITHGIDEALLLGDRVCIMNKGPGSRIVAEFTVASRRPRQLADDRALADLAAQIRATFATFEAPETADAAAIA
jgi:NitT/TauT family transport system ATP-binding protein